MNRKTSTKFSLVLFFVVILINYLTATGKIPGLSPQKEISSLYHTPITPAGFAFSIWGVIYILLFVAILYMIKISSDKGPRSFALEKLIVPLRALFAFNIIWNIVFGLGWIGFSFVMIVGYWLSLVVIGISLVKTRAVLNPILPVAFGLHTGWISIASVVNLYAFFVKIGWNGMGLHQDVWVIITIVFVLLLVALLQIWLKNPVTPLGTAWAFFGIYAKEGAAFSEYPFIPILLLAGIVLLFFFSVMTFIRNGKSLLSQRFGHI